MAEESLPPAEGEPEVVDVPEEQVSASKTIEDFARERGWNPDYDGEDRRSAEEFIAFGMDRNKDLLRDVRELRETTDRMARTQAQITEQAVERARVEERAMWEERHQRAVEEGDLRTATTAVQKISELSNPAPSPQGVDPSVERFVVDNPWFNTDHAARAVATAEAGIIAAQGGSVQQQLQAALSAVHKRFPEYAPQQAKAAPAVAQPASRATDTRNRKKGFNDMPAEAQQACRELVKRGLTTQDGYVGNYFGQGAA